MGILLMKIYNLTITIYYCKNQKVKILHILGVHMIQKQVFIQKIANACKDNNIAIFLGAGMSVDTGLPSWKTLFEPLARELNIDINYTNYQLYDISQFYANRFGKNNLQTGRIIGGRGVFLVQDTTGIHIRNQGGTILRTIGRQTQYERKKKWEHSSHAYNVSKKFVCGSIIKKRPNGRFLVFLIQCS